MTNWPTAPLIHITKGSVGCSDIKNVIAVPATIGTPTDGYYIVTGESAGRSVLPNFNGDRIDAWEEATAVPTSTLKRLRDVFMGADLDNRRFAALQEVLSCLPADKPSPLDQAVTRVKDIEGGRMIDAETLPADRLSLLLDALASVQGTVHKIVPLAMVARICVDWVQADNPEKIAIEQMQSRALSIPEVVGSDPARFIVLAGYIGDAANVLSEAHLDISGQLTNAGTYALAWAAQIIEEKDK